MRFELCNLLIAHAKRQLNQFSALRASNTGGVFICAT